MDQRKFAATAIFNERGVKSWEVTVGWYSTFEEAARSLSRLAEHYHGSHVEVVGYRIDEATA